MSTPTEVSGSSQRSRGITLALAAILGPFGAHRFYVGKNGTGMLMLATLGGLGVWYVYDLITIVGGSFRDASGRLVTRWDPESVADEPPLPEALLREVDALRSEVADLSERLDFAERLLAQPPGLDAPIPSIRRS
jgi:TM2 domain-containing membrane protein YozV